MKFFLFRHGQTDWNKEERFQGHIDIPLNETGKMQARALVEPLRATKIELILSSDLSRARETAEIVARGLGLSVISDPRLREANLGEAQGLTRAEIENRFGLELAARWRSWKVSDGDIFYPGGETGRSVYERTYAMLEEFAKAHEKTLTVGVATHGGVIRRMLQPLLPEGSPPVPIPNGIIYELEYMHSKWKLLTVPTETAPSDSPSFG